MDKTGLTRRLLVLAFCMAMTYLAQGRTITVGHGGSYDFRTIQAAIDDANDADKIIVADGTYTGDGNRDIDFLGKAIIVCSANGPDSCIIDCNGTEAQPHRGFYFGNREDSNSVLEGFTITNGYIRNNNGGGIYCSGSSPTIEKCVIGNNEVRTTDLYLTPDVYGGGIYCGTNASPRIVNCTISNNKATNVSTLAWPLAFGGGIYCSSSSNALLTNCTISGNSASVGGGGMVNHGGNPKLTNCTFIGNGDGMLDLGSSTLMNCTFAHNMLGMSNEWGNAKLVNCTFKNNVFRAMYNLYSQPILINCTFCGNSTPDDGAGMFNDASNPTLVNCTFSGNRASRRGGAIYNWGGEPTLTNCILWRDMPDEIYVYSGKPVVTYSNVRGGWPGEGNIDAEPLFEAKEGRWTKDDVTSPCIDAGNMSSPIGNEPFPNGGIVNMGAYGGTAEASKSYFGGPVCKTVVAGDINGDCIVNFVDFAILGFHWLECTAPECDSDEQPAPPPRR